MHQYGTKYQVIHVATHTETAESIVGYREFDPIERAPIGRSWARPMDMFQGKTE